MIWKSSIDLKIRNKSYVIWFGTNYKELKIPETYKGAFASDLYRGLRLDKHSTPRWELQILEKYISVDAIYA